MQVMKKETFNYKSFITRFEYYKKIELTFISIINFIKFGIGMINFILIILNLLLLAMIVNNIFVV